MLSDDTKQGYIFLESFAGVSAELNEDEHLLIAGEIALEFNNGTYHATSPRSLDELYDISFQKGYIEKVSTFRSRLTEKGEVKLNELFDKIMNAEFADKPEFSPVFEAILNGQVNVSNGELFESVMAGEEPVSRILTGELGLN